MFLSALSTWQDVRVGRLDRTDIEHTLSSPASELCVLRSSHIGGKRAVDKRFKSSKSADLSPFSGARSVTFAVKATEVAACSNMPSSPHPISQVFEKSGCWEKKKRGCQAQAHQAQRIFAGSEHTAISHSANSELPQSASVAKSMARDLARDFTTSLVWNCCYMRPRQSCASDKEWWCDEEWWCHKEWCTCLASSEWLFECSGNFWTFKYL